MGYQVFKPDEKWFSAIAAKIVRLSKVDEAMIDRVEINCGSAAGRGAVILKDGSRINV